MIHKHFIAANMSSLSIIGGWAMHYLPEVALFMPTVYYCMLMWTWLVNKQWKRRP